MSTESYTPETNQPEPYGQAPQGYAPQGYAPQTVIVQAPARPGNGLGVAGFVTGLLGLIFCWVPAFGVVLALLGVILGGVGIATGRKKGAPIGLAVSGLVLGIVALIPAVVILSAAASIAGSV